MTHNFKDIARVQDLLYFVARATESPKIDNNVKGGGISNRSGYLGN